MGVTGSCFMEVSIHCLSRTPCTKKGWTALMTASSKGNIDVVHALIAAGVDKEAADITVGGGGPWEGGSEGLLVGNGFYRVVWEVGRH